MQISIITTAAILILGIAKIWNKKIFLLLLAGALACTAVSALSMYGRNTLESIEKGNAGTGSKRYELTADIENENEVDISIAVPEKALSKKEAESLLTKEKKLLAEQILGNNASFDNICHDLDLKETSADGSINISWHSSDQDILSSFGEIGSGIPKSGTQVKLKAILTMPDMAPDASDSIEFDLKVFPRASDGNLKDDLQRAVEETNAFNNGDKYKLPEKIDGRQVKWYQKDDPGTSAGAVIILFAGIFIAVSRRKRIDAEKKEKAEALMRDYPELVTRLMLMTASGSTVRGAFIRIASGYQKDRHSKKGLPIRPAFEETLNFCRDLENGISEGEAYERMAKRCALPAYRTLGVLLTQNVKKGSSSLKNALEQEAILALNDRKRRARLASDAAALKLLLPLAMMLMTALAIMLIPALMSM